MNPRIPINSILFTRGPIQGEADIMLRRIAGESGGTYNILQVPAVQPALAPPQRGVPVAPPTMPGKKR
jgi:hypothetical protein